MTRLSRRRALQALGGTLIAAGSTGAANAESKTNDPSKRFVEVPGVSGIDAQGTLAFGATGNGMSVVDWHNPNRAEVIADVETPGASVSDVKVDGDLLVVNSEGENERLDVGDPSVIGVHFYDISDPANPEFLSTWSEMPAGVHNQYLDGDVAYICRERPFDDSALRILDVSDPTNPTELSEYRVEDAHPELDTATNWVHDVVVQDDLAYLAYWDAGCRIVDVSDPTDPVEVSGFGEAPDATEPVPYEFGGDNDDPEYVRRFLGLPGNAHYVKPSPDGRYVYVGAETFPGAVPGQTPSNETYGGIKIFDVSDFDDPVQVARVSPPDVDAFRTSHNFDVTQSRLFASWYDGGVTVHDISDPSNPRQLAHYQPSGSSFWTAFKHRGNVILSHIGDGIEFLPGLQGRAGGGNGRGRGSGG